MADLDQLERLAKLREAGALSEEEFQQQKAQLLAGTPDSPAPSAPDPTLTASGHKKVSGKQAALVLGAMVALCAVLVVPGLLSKGSTPSNPSSFKASSNDAFYMCHQFVNDKLKAPATADYVNIADESSVVTSLGNNRFRVKGLVDAENSFGATIRNTYECTLKAVDDDTWRAESVTVKE